MVLEDFFPHFHRTKYILLPPHSDQIQHNFTQQQQKEQNKTRFQENKELEQKVMYLNCSCRQ